MLIEKLKNLGRNPPKQRLRFEESPGLTPLQLFSLGSDGQNIFHGEFVCNLCTSRVVTTLIYLVCTLLAK